MFPSPVSPVFQQDELARYREDGYFLVRGLFTRDEIGKLLEFARGDSGLQTGTQGRKDAAGMETRLALFNHVGDDLYSMFARSARLVGRVEQILSGEVYHYHSKMRPKPKGINQAKTVANKAQRTKSLPYFLRNPLTSRDSPTESSISGATLISTGDSKELTFSSSSGDCSAAASESGHLRWAFPHGCPWRVSCLGIRDAPAPVQG